jgi:hypothetical protein
LWNGRSYTLLWGRELRNANVIDAWEYSCFPALPTIFIFIFIFILIASHHCLTPPCLGPLLLTYETRRR